MILGTKQSFFRAHVHSLDRRPWPFRINKNIHVSHANTSYRGFPLAKSLNIFILVSSNPQEKALAMAHPYNVPVNSNWVHPPGNFFEPSESQLPGQIILSNCSQCPGAKNDGRIPRGGAKFSQCRRNCSLTTRQYKFFIWRT